MKSPINRNTIPQQASTLQIFYSIRQHVAHQDLSLLITLSLLPHNYVQHSCYHLPNSRTISLLQLILINEDNPLLLNSIKALLAGSIFNDFLSLTERVGEQGGPR